MLALEDKIIARMPHFSLYEWQQAALKVAPTPEDKALFLWNANHLLTLWANKDGAKWLHDYAHKEWSGMLSSFYQPRWEMYFDHLSDSLSGTPSPAPDFYKWEKEWDKTILEKPVMPEKSVKELVNEMMQTAI